MVSPKNKSSKSLQSNKPKLSPTQAKVVKAKIKAELTDIPQGIVAQEVFPNATPASAGVLMSRELKKVNVSEALELAFHELKLTPMTLAATVANGIGAHKFAQVEGDFIETEVPDHGIRLKAAGMAAQWMGIGKGEAMGSPSIHFHQHTADKKAQYES